MKAISLAYHDVIDQRPRTFTDQKFLYKLDRESFHTHILSIHQQAMNISVRSIHQFARWGMDVPVFLTFDDGELGAYTHVADELERYGWRGHFFITTDWIGRTGFLNRRQIRELQQRGHVIGSHSCSHPERMSQVCREALEAEWSQSCSILSDILSEKTRVASVPGGYYSRRVAETAAAAGIEVLFTSEATSKVSVLDGCLVLGRYFIQMNTPAAVSGAIAAGRLWPRWRQAVLWEAKKPVKAVTGKLYSPLRRSILKFLPRATTATRVENSLQEVRTTFDDSIRPPTE
jgi:peptidoglycan/xylan/chitin deacetylase (PgdA/CDA1 family)